MELIQNVSLVIEPDVMREANETQSFNLAVPTDEDGSLAAGVKKGKNKNGETFVWTELLNVKTSDIGIVPAGTNGEGDPTPERVFIDVKFEVAPETLHAKNVGRTVKQRYLINPSEMSNRQSKERIMSLMAIGKLNGLLRACGFDIDPGVQTDLGAYFTPNADGESQVSGIQVYADFKNYNDKNGVPRQDIAAYDGTDSAGA